jgi:hypothetical protein
MPSTITLAISINGLKAFIEQQPTLINGMEPALSSANLIKQTMLGPPMAWPWNRGSVTYTTGVQDWTVSGLNDFGFLEGGSVQEGEGKPWALQVKNTMEYDQSDARPQYISHFGDDGQGNVTFRLIPAPDPDLTYTVNLFYQRQARPMLSLASPWNPIPDDKYYMPQWGLLAMMSLIGNDSRFNEYNAKFITSVLAHQGGLSDTEKALFAANWTRALATAQSTQLSTSERYRARET